MGNEHRAKEQAYQEYLKLRQNNGSRGNYVKDDTLYGAYFPSGGQQTRQQNNQQQDRRQTVQFQAPQHDSRQAVGETPYGESQMRRRQQELERQRYMEERAAAREEERRTGKRGKPIAVPGRKNKADDEAYGWSRQHSGKKKGNGKSKKNGKGLKTAFLVVLILVIGVGGLLTAGLVVVKETLANVGRIEIDQSQIGINPQVDAELENYRNIAILGIDARDMDNHENVRSDAIIVASINKETGEIKMFSVYRDTMLNLGDDTGLDKITHAYYYGGPTKVLYTLNKNMDLNVKEAVVVNWKSVADTVDALGGIDVEIQESEIEEMNKYIKNTYNAIGGSDKLITEPGMQTLNGNQAVTYARIRKDALTGDYRRNERMKIVVKATFDKAKAMKPGTIKRISRNILPQIKTNMTTTDMMGMVLDLVSYNMTDSVGFPYDVSDYNSGAYYGVPVTLEANVRRLHEEFFAQEGYAPTQDVLDISYSIADRTGYY